MSDTIEVGEIVQIDPEHDQRFAACLLVVTEVRSWGVQGYVQNAGSEGEAYYRVENGKFERTGGKAVWVKP